MLDRGLRDNRADQIVGQDVRPDLLMHRLGCFAAKVVHLHCRLDRSQVEFVVPPGAIQGRQVVLRGLQRVQQRRDHHDPFGAESRLGDANPRFSNGDSFGKRFVGLPIQRTNATRLMPGNDVVIVTEALPTPKVRLSIGFVEATDQFNAALLEHPNVRPIGHQTIGQQNVSPTKHAP